MDTTAISEKKDSRLPARTKRVYFFGEGKADGDASMKNLLGGKGANLAEMVNLGVPVPPGFTITTEVCNEYLAKGHRMPEGLAAEIESALDRLGRIAGARLGDPENPRLVS